MAKMYYTEEEACEKLGVSTEDLANHVRNRDLRLFKDGARNMYMASEVDALAEASQGEEAEGEEAPAADTASVGGEEDPQRRSQQGHAT